MKVFVARHGESDWNARSAVCGMGNGMLTEKGKAEAQALADKLKAGQKKNQIKYIFVSPLQRARDTASYTERALGLHAVVDDRLHEVYFGLLEDASYSDSEFNRIKNEPFVSFPEGESLTRTAQRVYNFLDELKAKKLDGNVLLVCHGMMMKVVRTYFKDISMDEFRHFSVSNCALEEYEL